MCVKLRFFSHCTRHTMTSTPTKLHILWYVPRKREMWDFGDGDQPASSPNRYPASTSIATSSESSVLAQVPVRAVVWVNVQGSGPFLSL